MGQLIMRKKALHKAFPMEDLAEKVRAERIEAFIGKRQRECELYRERNREIVHEMNKGVEGVALTLEQYLKA